MSDPETTPSEFDPRGPLALGGALLAGAILGWGFCRYQVIKTLDQLKLSVHRDPDPAASPAAEEPAPQESVEPQSEEVAE